MNNVKKSALISSGAGIVIVALVGLFLTQISLDMRWMSLFALTLAYSTTYLIAMKGRQGLMLTSSVILTIPYGIFFWLVIYPDLPSLLFTVPLYFISALLGFYTYSAGKRKWLFMAGNLVVIIMTIFTIPMLIGNDLTQVTNEEGVYFELTTHTGEVIKSDQLRGKSVVLDFYGTWCKPCIAELPELAKVKDHFAGNPNVEFIIVNSDQGGDNLEKAKKFAKRFDFDFTYAYDYDRETYKKLRLESSGVPSIIMLDAKGNIRLRHVGYNKSETDFVDNMIGRLTKILNY